MIYGIKFNGKHSNDLGYTIEERTIGFPSKNKILIAVPFSNVEHDFSELYGSQVYNPRPLTYKFNVLPSGKLTPDAMQIEKTKIINWLVNSHGKQRLYDDTIPGYYFWAEVIDAADLEDDWETGSLTVKFTAYPFMIAELPEGNDIWDTFNFELDVAQIVDFEVSGDIEVTLINAGVPDVIPEITCSSQMTIIKDGISYTIVPGTTKDQDFMLKSGENDLKITGNGKISFKFFKELI